MRMLVRDEWSNRLQASASGVRVGLPNVTYHLPKSESPARKKGEAGAEAWRAHRQNRAFIPPRLDWHVPRYRIATSPRNFTKSFVCVTVRTVRTDSYMSEDPSYHLLEHRNEHAKVRMKTQQ